MAKRASKAKPSTSGGAGAGAKRQSRVSSPARSATKTAKKAAATAEASKDGASTTPSKRASAGAQKPGSSPAGKGQGQKLKEAGKAKPSGDGARGGKTSRVSASAKKKAATAPQEAAGARTGAEKPGASGTAQKKKSRAAKRVTFDRKTLTSIKKSLKDQRQDLVDQLTEIEEAAFSPSQTEASSEAGFDEDYADAGTATFEREKDLSIANNINSLVDKIDKALEKIEQGTYGICENCGQPISADRLKALPHVFLCINCKKAEERR